MTLQQSDIKITIVPDDLVYNYLENVVGNTGSFKIKFGNLNPTDPMYDLSVTLKFPDGLTYISSTGIASTNKINDNYENIVEFININDIWPNQNDVILEVNYKIEEYYRGDRLPVPYNILINGLTVTAEADSTPQGSSNINNIKITNSSSINVKVFRYQALFTGPSEYLKGAGTSLGDTVDASKIFTVNILLINSTRDSSTISLTNTLPNGMRYVGVWSSSGTNASNFLNPIISPVSSPTNNNVKIYFNNKILSRSSRTTLSYQVAIWNKYTVSGVENSGATILNDDELTTNLLVTGNNTSYPEEYSVNALEVLISETLDTNVTDINVIQDHTITYSTDGYSPVNTTVITKIIPNGLKYVNDSSSIPPNSVVSNVDGTSKLTWNIGSLTSNNTSLINMRTQTLEKYINGDDIYSGDYFKNSSTMNCINPLNNKNLEDSSENTMQVAIPSITKEVSGYYDSSLNLKPIELATTGDYIRFNVTYDARTVSAKQRSVELYDFCPPELNINKSIKLTITGNPPPGITYEVISNNGTRIDAGDLDGGSYFSFNFYVPILPLNDDLSELNLSKLHLLNSENTSLSTRDSVLVYLGRPHLQVNTDSSIKDCISLEDTLTYTVTIVNSERFSEEESYVSDAYNLIVTSTIPSLFSIIGTPIISSSTTVNPITIKNNIMTMTIPHLKPEDFLTIKSSLTVVSPPILGNSYGLDTSISPGTSQVSPDSYHFPDADFPYSQTITIPSCSVKISSYYINPKITLGDYYTSYLVITVPKGIIAYNTKIKESLVTTDSSNFKNILLNGVTPSYSLSTNNLQIPLLDVMDTSSGELVYLLQYEDRMMNISPINYQDVRVVPGAFSWSQIPTFPDNLSVNANGTITIVVPGISTIKYQQNQTRGTDFGTAPLVCTDYDNINYKLSLSNIGKSPAIQTVITDTIPKTLTINSITGGESSFNHISNIVTVTIPSIDVNKTSDIVINTTVANDAKEVVATNNSFSSFKANSNLNTIYGTSTSNTTVLYKNLVALIKYQRNVEVGDNFTTGEIRCFANQHVQYKLVLENPLDTALENITINDYFPSNFIFTSYNPLPRGTFEVNNNNVTIKIPSIEGNSTFEVIYTIQLNVDSLAKVSSQATTSYKFVNGDNVLTTKSNTVYILCSSLGKGYRIY